MSVVDLALGELGDRRGLARPVDADEQPYGRPVRRVVQRPVDAREVVDDLLAQERDELLGVVNARRHRPRPELVEQAGRRRHADVGDEQRLLDAVPGFVVDGAPPAEGAERSGDGGARLAQPVKVVADVHGRSSQNEPFRLRIFTPAAAFSARQSPHHLSRECIAGPQVVIDLVDTPQRAGNDSSILTPVEPISYLCPLLAGKCQQSLFHLINTVDFQLYRRQGRCFACLPQLINRSGLR